MTIVTIGLSLIAAGVAGILCIYFYFECKHLKDRFRPIVDADAELRKVRSEYERVRRGHQEFVNQSKGERERLAADYEQANALYSELKAEVSLLEENLEDISFGLYKPHFSFDSSEKYKRRLETLREAERQMIRAGSAVSCSVQWNVAGDAKLGEKMARQNMKLILRAFNGECDAALSKVTWNNILRMEERVKKCYEAVNKLGSVLQVSVSHEFLMLKLSELRLTYEYEQKKQDERDEQRRIRERMREEVKVQRELEEARIEAEREERKYEIALEQARAEANRATGERLLELKNRIDLLNAQLEEAHKQKERAISQAQLTKAGHVYVISNIGSFGEDVFKVGMTRRLEPEERIKELGDASVPFPFDIHALLYCENAPELEAEIHSHLDEHRINVINLRKEFFRVPLATIESFAMSRGIKVEFTKLAEAREFRETVAARADTQITQPAKDIAYRVPLFPDPITPITSHPV